MVAHQAQYQLTALRRHQKRKGTSPLPCCRRRLLSVQHEQAGTECMWAQCPGQSHGSLVEGPHPLSALYTPDMEGGRAEEAAILWGPTSWLMTAPCIIIWAHARPENVLLECLDDVHALCILSQAVKRIAGSHYTAEAPKIRQQDPLPLDSSLRASLQHLLWKVSTGCNC